MRKEVRLIALSNLGPPLAGALTAPVLARTLGTVERGELAASLAPLVLLTSVATIGMTDALTHYVSAGRSNGRAWLRKVALLLLFLGIVATLTLVPLSSLLAGGEAGVKYTLIIGTSFLAPSLLVAAFRAEAMGNSRWGRVAAERMIGAFARLVGVSTFAIAGWLDVRSAVLLTAGAPLIGALVYIGRPRLPEGAAGEGNGPPPSVREFARYSTAVWIGSLAGILLLRVDQLLILPLSSATELGIYVVAVTVAEVILAFNNAVRDVTFARESRTGSHSSTTSIAKVSRVSTIVTIASAALVGLIAIPLVPAVFGAAFSPATAVIAILLAGLVVGNPGSVAGAALSGRGAPHLRSIAISLGLVVNIIALCLLVPVSGAIGAALATLVGNAVSGTMCVVFFRRMSMTRLSEFYQLKLSDLVWLWTIAVPVRFRQRNRGKSSDQGSGNSGS